MKSEKPTAVFTVSGGAEALFSPAIPRERRLKGDAVIRDWWAPSRFNFAVRLREGEKAVYNSAFGVVAVMDDRTWKRCLGPGARHSVSGGSIPAALRTLHVRGFLVSEGVNELEMVRLHYLGARHAGEHFSVNIVPTMACNLRCPYCFEGKAQDFVSGKAMSRRVEQAVARYVLQLARGKRRGHIVWFGGEPLMSLGTIGRLSSRLTPAFRHDGIKFTQTIVTNGVLLTRRVAEQLGRAKVSFAQVTVDIPSETKRDRLGRDTLDTVLDNIRAATKWIEVYLRINLVRDDEAQFDRLYRGLLQRGLHKKLKAVMLAHVVEPECGRSGSDFRRAPWRQYVKVMARERARARSMGLPIECLPTGVGSSCAATCRHSAAIDPQGLVYKCVEDLGLPQRAYASVLHDEPLKMQNLTPWLTYDWFQYSRCRRCPVLPQCAGGCPHKRMYQSRGRRSEDFCYWHIRGDLANRIREHALRGLGARPTSSNGLKAKPIREG